MGTTLVKPPVPNPGGRNFDELDELTLLAVLIAGEARGEPPLGQIAVGFVVMNRVAANAAGWFGTGLHGVCLKPWAFSCFLGADPNRAKLVRPIENFGLGVWRQCYRSAAAAYFGLVPDPSGSADHYLNTAVVQARTGKLPSWADPTKIVATIDDHTFYKLRT